MSWEGDPTEEEELGDNDDDFAIEPELFPADDGDEFAEPEPSQEYN